MREEEEPVLLSIVQIVVRLSFLAVFFSLSAGSLVRSCFHQHINILTYLTLRPLILGSPTNHFLIWSFAEVKEPIARIQYELLGETQRLLLFLKKIKVTILFLAFLIESFFIQSFLFIMLPFYQTLY